MYCKKCGKEIDDDSRYCEHCGESTSKVTKKNTNTSNNTLSNNINTKPEGYPVFIILGMIVHLIIIYALSMLLRTFCSWEFCTIDKSNIHGLVFIMPFVIFIAAIIFILYIVSFCLTDVKNITINTKEIMFKEGFCVAWWGFLFYYNIENCKNGISQYVIGICYLICGLFMFFTYFQPVCHFYNWFGF